MVNYSIQYLCWQKYNVDFERRSMLLGAVKGKARARAGAVPRHLGEEKNWFV